MNSARGNELVPLEERMAHLALLRALVVAAVVGWALWSSGTGRGVVIGSLAYLAVLTSAAGWRASGRRSSLAWSLMVAADGAYLVWATWATDGLDGPVRHLLLAQAVAVTLLSARTGLQLALGQGLLLAAAYHLGEADVIAPLAAGTDRLSPLGDLVLFALALVLVAACTSALSAQGGRELRRRRDDLEALGRLARAVEQERSAREVADRLLEHVIDTFDLERGVVLASPEGTATLLAVRGVATPTARRPELEAGSIVERAKAARTTLLERSLDAADDPWLDELLPGAAHVVVTPLSVEQRVVGALVLEGRAPLEGRVARRVVPTLERFADHGVLALENAWLIERQTRMTSTDGLTGVANRRTFGEVLEAELNRAGRTGDHLSLLLLDLDHFSQLNDSYGHQVGDEVLRVVASSLQVECRDFDTVARYGGEEFAVVLPGCGAGDSFAMAERLRACVASARSPAAVTASAGVATYPLDAADAASLLRAADEALQSAKQAGRNRLSVSTKGEERLHAFAADQGSQ